MATFTKRKDGWFVQVRRKGYSARYKTLSTKAEAQAWAREQETLIDKRQTPTDLRGLRVMTLGDLIDRYAREVTPRKRGAESEASRLGKMGRAPMSEISLLRTIIDLARREWDVALIEKASAVRAMDRRWAGQALKGGVAHCCQVEEADRGLFFRRPERAFGVARRRRLSSTSRHGGEAPSKISPRSDPDPILP